MKDRCDILIIGGGINGAAIARAAAVAGHDVMLIEEGDLAQATSSASTKLIHGGLRYLERFEFKLVRESLRERAILLRTAPHIVQPLQFYLPHDPAIRPWPVVRAGLLLYDLLAINGGLPRSRAITLPDGRRGFSYWDGGTDDARLVVLNALDAAEAGAAINSRSRFLSARPVNGRWQAELALKDGTSRSVNAAIIVNAAGPWISSVLREGFGESGAKPARLVRGSHVVLRHAAPGPAFLLQQADGRIVFAIPYARDFTLVGTTDIPVECAGDDQPSAEERTYLLAAARAHFGRDFGDDDIAWAFAGIRALHDDGSANPSAVSRDYRLVLDRRGGAPLLSVYGGKLTTARHLAEMVLRRLGLTRGDTSRRPLPGGDTGPFPAFLGDVRRRWPFLGDGRSERMARAYGSRLAMMLGEIGSEMEMGEDFGGGLTRTEVDYLIRNEWAATAEDVAWRRSKLGLHLSARQIERLAAYMAGRTS